MVGVQPTVPSVAVCCARCLAGFHGVDAADDHTGNAPDNVENRSTAGTETPSGSVQLSTWRCRRGGLIRWFAGRRDRRQPSRGVEYRPVAEEPAHAIMMALELSITTHGPHVDNAQRCTSAMDLA